MNTVSTFISGGLRYVKAHPQLLFTLLLIVVIPFAFLISGQQFLKASKDNQERLEKDRIGMMHDLFASYLQAVSFDPELVQAEIEKIVSLNPDISKFRVAKDTNREITPVASFNVDVIGVPTETPGVYRLAQPHQGESIITPYVSNHVRHWQSFRLVLSDDNEEYYIFTETSLAGLDALFAQRIRDAYYWLFGLLTIVLLLVLRHVRLIDYGFLYRETKQANEMKDLFTNMIAHELRAPLTAIRGYASMIGESQEIPEEEKKYAVRVKDSSERLLAIVNDLLDVARIQSGKLKVEKIEADLSRVVVAVCEELTPSAQEKEITLSYTGVKVEHISTIDPKRMHQAIANLVSNAIKYTKKGTIELLIEEKTTFVELRVKDTGMGITAKDQKKLFAPFFRVESDDVSQITGTGLGMWITRQLIELMGASIAVESIKGVGTHIVITVPK
ncbi:HAMP domain-containing histidine kinase [Candidatus Pacebacteria bacterium]|nr:HAMP domain-containing histidine kinase [Candidatus Paceibacterota bacterium]